MKVDILKLIVILLKSTLLLANPLTCSTGSLTTLETFGKGIEFNSTESTGYVDDWGIYVVVGTCQESLEWLSCDWHPRIRGIHVIHKCTPEHPGNKRCQPPAGPSFKLCPIPWRNQSWPKQQCMTHSVSNSNRGREASVYMEFILKNYDDIREQDLILFLQGSPDEIGKHGSWDGKFTADFQAPEAQDTWRGMLERITPVMGFASLSGVVIGAPSLYCDFPPVTTLLNNSVRNIDCHQKYVWSMRATFVASGRRIKSISNQIWRKLFDLLETADNDHWMGIKFEQSWSLIFDCCWKKGDPGKLHKLHKKKDIFVSGGLECYDPL